VRLKNGRYQIIAGWERAFAIRRLGDRNVVVDVYEDISDEEACSINVGDNAMRGRDV
jgi:ParB-like chromosome segregation protein Spo0J